MSPDLEALGWQLLTDGVVADLYLAPQADGTLLVYKILRDDTPLNRRAFAREYRLLKRKVHDGLVPVLAGDVVGPRPYYVMPFLSGGQLTNWAGKLHHDVLRDVARRLAETIAAMHASDLEHGDIKPDNALVAREGTLHVTDPLGNGSGCTLTWGTKWGGTPGYWAPEIAMGLPISKAGDVFSFGATLYHLATGIRPKDGQAFDSWPATSSVPLEIRKVIMAACRVQPTARPTIHQVLAFLTPRPPTPPPRRSGRWGPLAALGALIVGIVLIGSGGRR